MTESIMKHGKQLNFISEYGYDFLTEWEQKFIDSISIRLNKEIDTTFNQQKILNRIYLKVQEKVG